MPNVNDDGGGGGGRGEGGASNAKSAMAEDEDILIEEEEQDQKKVAGKHDSGAADLAKVVNYGFFDEEGGGQNDVGGPGTISGAARSIIDSKRCKEDAERVARQKLLANVAVRKEDVELIMHEMEITRSDAELRLRQAMGNVVQALITLINE